MYVVVITPPDPAVAFEDVEKHLGDVPAEDKQYVEVLTAAATAWIDGPAGWLGRCIGTQTLEYRGDYWPEILPYQPAINVVSAMVGDQQIEGVEVHEDGHLSRPDHLPDGSVVIQYRAGYAETPAQIKVAIMMLVAQWYNTRENVITGTITSQMPFAVDALLQPYRVYR